MFVPLCHNTLYISTQKQVLSSYFDLSDVLNLDDMANIGRGESINLLYLFYGVIVFIVHKVGSAEFSQMRLGVVGTPVFSFGGNLMTIGICPKCGGLHGEKFFHLLGCQPLGDLADVNGHTEELINMFLAVVVLASDTADGYSVAFGRGIKPRLLDLIKSHNLFTRIEVQHSIVFLFPQFLF